MNFLPLGKRLQDAPGVHGSLLLAFLYEAGQSSCHVEPLGLWGCNLYLPNLGRQPLGSQGSPTTQLHFSATSLLYTPQPLKVGARRAMREGVFFLGVGEGTEASKRDLPPASRFQRVLSKRAGLDNGAICIFRKALASQRSAARGDPAPTPHPSLAPTLQRKNRKEGEAGAVGKPCTCPCRGPRLAGAEPCGCGQIRHNRSRCGRSQGLGGSLSLPAGGEDPGRCGTRQRHSWRGPGTLRCGPVESWNVRTRP